MSDKIGVHLSFKKNMGNYEMLDIGVDIEKSVEDVHDQDTWKAVWDEADSQLDSKLQEVVNG